MSRIPLLVLGMGDAACRDDGVGVAAVARLARRWRAPEGVRLLDGGTSGSRCCRGSSGRTGCSSSMRCG